METVTLRVPDLVQIRDAINSSYFHNVSLDMAESYRKLNRQNRSSPMTLALKVALDTTNDYLEAATGKEPTSEDRGELVP